MTITVGQEKMKKIIRDRFSKPANKKIETPEAPVEKINEVAEAPVEDIKVGVTKPFIEPEIKTKRETKEATNEGNEIEKGKGEHRGTRKNGASNRRKEQRRKSGIHASAVPKKERKGVLGIPWW